MKRCPQCGQSYTDDLSFCLQDGSALAPVYEEPETPTVVRPPAARPTEAAPRSGGRWAKLLLIALVALFALGIAGAAGAYFVWTRLAGDDAAANRTAPNTTPARRTPQAPSPTPDRDAEKRQAELERERERLTQERKRLEEAKKDQSNNEEPEFTDPGTSRIAFRRGRASETVSGRIAQERSFVLRTLAGQQLTASIASDNDCVAFADGGTRTSFTTPAGDAALTLANTCSRPASFRLTVSVR